MLPQRGFHVGARAVRNGLQAGHWAPSPHDRVVLAPVLDGIEEVGEVAGGVRCRDFRHEIRLSDLPDIGEKLEQLRQVLESVSSTTEHRSARARRRDLRPDGTRRAPPRVRCRAVGWRVQAPGLRRARRGDAPPTGEGCGRAGRRASWLARSPRDTFVRGVVPTRLPGAPGRDDRRRACAHGSAADGSCNTSPSPLSKSPSWLIGALASSWLTCSPRSHRSRRSTRQ